MSVKTATGNVQTEERAGRVFHNIHDDEFGEMYSFLTPDMARSIAAELIAAATAAEKDGAA